MTFFLCLMVLGLASLGQSMMGFGGGLIAIPLLSLLVGVKDAVMLGLVMQCMTGFLALRDLDSLPWQQIRPLLLGILPAALVGTFLLQWVSASWLRMGLAVFVLLFLLKSVCWPKIKLVPSAHWGWGVFAGGVSGLIQGSIGTGGPPLVIYLSETAPTAAAMRLSMLVVLTVVNLMRLAVAIPSGMFHQELRGMALWSIPCILLTMLIGQKLHHLISEAIYRHIVHLILLGAVVSLLLK